MAVTSKSIGTKLELNLLRMKHFAQEVFSQFCLGGIVRGKKGMMILAETLQQLQFQVYLRSNPDYLQDSQYIKAFQTMLANAVPNKSAEWKFHEVKMKGLTPLMTLTMQVVKKQSVQVLICFS